MDLPPVLSPIAAEMARVEAVIRARLASDVRLVQEVAAHIVDGGGKRLRPALLLLAGAATGARGEARRFQVDDTPVALSLKP